MPFIPVNNGALVEIKFLLGTTIVENTMWFENLVTPTVPLLQNLATNVATAFSTYQSAYQSADVTLYEVKATSMESDTAPTYTHSLTPPVAGGVATPRCPGSVTWAVQFRSTNRGRSFRGRNYWVGLGESQVSGDSITSTLANAIITAYNDFKGEVEIDGWSMVICSRFTNGAPRASGLTTPVASFGYADLFVDNQRRRLAGRGS